MAVYKVTQYQGRDKQRLSNVAMMAPSLVWVKSGKKKLFWQNQVLEIAHKRVLLVPALQTLTFENQPENQHFSSLLFNFLLPPTTDTLQRNQTMANTSLPVIEHQPAIANTLQFLLDNQNASERVQTYWLYGFYQQLAELGKLHLLYPQRALVFSQRVSDYLQQIVDKENPVEYVCTHFAISRATLFRRLKAENISFKQLVITSRMAYALDLMQQGERNQLHIALQCGYRSQERFSQRFARHFGLSAKAYIRTL